MKVSEQNHAAEGLPERRIMLLSRGKGHILTQVRGKMEIPAGMKGLPASPKTHQLPTSRALLAKAF